LKMLWPTYVSRINLMALLFLVYPGFTQQFVSINSSRHILPLAFFSFSLGCMVIGVRQNKRFFLFAPIALSTMLFSMLATEYYYGLEFIRPIILWLALDGKSETRRGRLRLTLQAWLPYAVLMSGVLIWRYLLSHKMNYPITILNDLEFQPLNTILQSIETNLQYLYLVLIEAWKQTLSFPPRAIYGLRIVALYWIAMFASITTLFIYLNRCEGNDSRSACWKQAMFLGGSACLVSGGRVELPCRPRPSAIPVWGKCLYRRSSGWCFTPQGN